MLPRKPAEFFMPGGLGTRKGQSWYDPEALSSGGGKGRCRGLASDWPPCPSHRIRMAALIQQGQMKGEGVLRTRCDVPLPCAPLKGISPSFSVLTRNLRHFLPRVQGRRELGIRLLSEEVREWCEVGVGGGRDRVSV